MYIGFPCYSKIAEIPPLDFCWIVNTGTNRGLLKKWSGITRTFEKQGLTVDGRHLIYRVLLHCIFFISYFWCILSLASFWETRCCSGYISYGCSPICSKWCIFLKTSIRIFEFWNLSCFNCWILCKSCCRKKAGWSQ